MPYKIITNEDRKFFYKEVDEQGNSVRLSKAFDTEQEAKEAMEAESKASHSKPSAPRQTLNAPAKSYKVLKDTETHKANDIISFGPDFTPDQIKAKIDAGEIEEVAA